MHCCGVGSDSEMSVKVPVDLEDEYSPSIQYFIFSGPCKSHTLFNIKYPSGSVVIAFLHNIKWNILISGSNTLTILSCLFDRSSPVIRGVADVCGHFQGVKWLLVYLIHPLE